MVSHFEKGTQRITNIKKAGVNVLDNTCLIFLLLIILYIANPYKTIEITSITKKEYFNKLAMPSKYAIKTKPIDVNDITSSYL